jgi:hypothetical protein
MSLEVGGADEVSGYTLAVIDSGLGMPPADIEAANRRLAGEESFTIAPSKYLGHYVAGNLAARHGIGVRLDASPGNGITATVNIPPALLTSEPVVGVPAVPPDDRRELPTAGTPVAQEPAGVAVMAGAAVAGTQGPGTEEPGDAWRNGELQAGVTSSWPAPVGLSSGTPPPEPPPSRTQSGLVKRSRANGTGPGGAEPGPAAVEAPTGPPTAGPNGDLLAALSRHSANLQGIPGRGGQALYPPPSARGPQSVPPGSAAPPRPPTRRPAAGVGDPTARHDHIPGGEGWQHPPRPAEPATRGPDVGGGRSPHPPSGVPGPEGPTGPGPARGPEAGPPLTRRVRGAQMPTTSPMSLRRTTGEQPAATGGPAARPRDRAQPPQQTRSADDVYSFLTSFTAGVRRGLDDARLQDRPGDDNGSR